MSSTRKFAKPMHAVGHEPDTGKTKHQHDFVATGTLRSWCRKCNHDAEWDNGSLEFAPINNKLTCWEPDPRWQGYFGNPYLSSIYTNDWSSK